MFLLRTNEDICRFSLVFYCSGFCHTFTGWIITSGPLLFCRFTTQSKDFLDLLQIFCGESEIKAFDLISGEPSLLGMCIICCFLFTITGVYQERCGMLLACSNFILFMKNIQFLPNLCHLHQLFDHLWIQFTIAFKSFLKYTDLHICCQPTSSHSCVTFHRAAGLL